jgi:hypothetical protein
MRGFFLGAIVLVTLDVLLKAPSTRIAVALATPTEWLAKWVDAETPLITAPIPSSTAAPAAPSATGNSLSAAQRAFASSFGASDSLPKLLNPVDEYNGTVDTAKGFADALNALAHAFG